MIIANTLFTIKGKPFAEQAAIIGDLEKRCVPLGNKLAELIKNQAKSKLVTISITKDEKKFRKAVLLMLLYSDIQSIPYREGREKYSKSFLQLCRFFDVGIEDIEYLLEHCGKIERVINSLDFR